MISVAINGFGRIGRCTLKSMLADDEFRVVGINDLSDLDDLAYLLKYDSVHGWYPSRVETEVNAIRVDDVRIPFFSERDPAKLPWSDLGAEVVLECTGAFRTRESAGRHLEAGAQKVAISAPAKDPDGTFVLTGLLDRPYTLVAVDPMSLATGRAPSVPAGTADARLVLTSTVTPRIEGRVVDRSGESVRGVTLRPYRTLQALRLEGRLLHRTDVGERAVLSDADGSFFLSELADEDVTVP